MIDQLSKKANTAVANREADEDEDEDHQGQNQEGDESEDDFPFEDVEVSDNQAIFAMIQQISSWSRPSPPLYWLQKNLIRSSRVL